MTFPLHELRDLIAPVKAATFGVCVSISNGMAKVATESGPVTATAGPGVRTGARVRIEGGTAQLAPAAIATYQV